MNDKVKNKSKTKRNTAIGKAYYLEGRSQREIGKDVGLSCGQVSRIVNDDEVKEIYDGVIRRAIATLPKAQAEHEKLVYQDEDKGTKLKAIELQYKIARVTSIGDSHAESPGSRVIQQIYIDQRTLNPANITQVRELLELKRRSDMDIDVQDVVDSDDIDQDDKK